MVSETIDDVVQDTDESIPSPITSYQSLEDLSSEIDSLVKQIQETYEEDPYLKVGFYGMPGVGKTWLAASFPKCLIIDSKEEGTKFVPRRFGARVLKAKRIRDIELAYWYLKQGNHPYLSVALDTTTSMAEMALNFVLKQNEEEGLSPDPKLANRYDYQKQGRIVGLLLSYFWSLPMNVILLSGERRQETSEDDMATLDDTPIDEELVVPHIFPELSPAMRSKMFRTVDILGRVTVRDVTVNRDGKEVIVAVRKLHTKTNPAFQAKDRTDSLPREIVSPTYAKIAKYINDAKEKK